MCARPAVRTLGDMSLLSQRFTCIDPGAWPAEKGRLRVLVEHPDRAVLTGAVDILRDAGYDVATCVGPDGGRRCPLVEFGRCSLVEDADVVVTSPELAYSDELLEIFDERVVNTVVVDVDPRALEEVSDVIPDATLVQLPLTPRSLREAVLQAASR
jgi:hypothetical protein